MRTYYTRACNFFYGLQARALIKQKKCLPLNGLKNIGFNTIELIQRKNRGKTKRKYFKISQIKNLDKQIKKQIKKDLIQLTSKKKKILSLNFSEPSVMGILNVTPDSFSDGGQYFNKIDAYKKALLMTKEGASIIDIGGESTRPGSKEINSTKEWGRIGPVIKKIKKYRKKIILSIDTRKSLVMKNSIKQGADIINDVSGFNFDKSSYKIICKKKPFIIINHSQGKPSDMQKNPKYNDVLLDIYDYFEEKINFFSKRKFNKKNIILDPGIGFGKNLEHNLRLISKISLFHSLGCPLLLGTSRKSFIKHIVTKFDTNLRTGGTISSVIYGLSQGVQIFRVHDVKEAKQGILVYKNFLNIID
ncbi:MAG: dihydropteroate synthase [Candidatus Pelagibacter sp. TMED64]|nr:dihydropteroate synthase [Candidatus Pelagibacter sp.]OUU65817.1 MAG: dihydropteroate synthase [Candidatus Pelagibacter sp. TMED64]